ncbi:uncharacterized protein PHALS_08024 [Plasmopara halstedii]|uniref:Uncharacterized protein n=1 Tax=Plasmopara halstedii TaxID=4781 RepID=A0A0P1B8M9_PLAHL|nr:uncharacterized protein PHALS_08024 [Plasmopara halstedii]CEG50303.1 hypothetical protein PHALS_08024 [Plasmopara halstedii]|eukprot:XP_024586672.1 hypothetical protein PHALS_08024 [Plasmopara halstedii]
MCCQDFGTSSNRFHQREPNNFHCLNRRAGATSFFMASRTLCFSKFIQEKNHRCNGCTNEHALVMYSYHGTMSARDPSIKAKFFLIRQFNADCSYIDVGECNGV